MIPAVILQILLCIQAAKAEAQERCECSSRSRCPVRPNSKTTQMGTDDGEYLVKWTLLALWSNTVSPRWEGQVNNVIAQKGNPCP